MHAKSNLASCKPLPTAKPKLRLGLMQNIERAYHMFMLPGEVLKVCIARAAVNETCEDSTQGGIHT